jgi:hypothetical protein
VSDENEAAKWFVQVRLDDFRVLAHAATYASVNTEYMKQFPITCNRLIDAIPRLDALMVDIEKQIAERKKKEMEASKK